MKAEHTKERILSQALTLFAQKGYEAVSVEEIAAAVGIKAPSLYKHYKGKRDIFDHIVTHMNHQDAARAQALRLPQGTPSEAAAWYAQAPLEQIRTYSRALFLHWTEEPFSAHFRRMLTLEQYRDPEMGRLYQHYLADGPIAYMTQLFRQMTDSDAQARQLALAFYGPLYLLYSLSDGGWSREAVLAAVDGHIDRFAAELTDVAHR